MGLDINDLLKNKDVYYHGKTLPRDKAPAYVPVVDPNIEYNGKTLPRDAIKYVNPGIDQTNLPSLVVLGPLGSIVSPFAGTITGSPPVTGASLQSGGVVLPADVEIRIGGKKIVPSTTIVDGVEVTQHIRRSANIVHMTFTVRSRTETQWIFGQDFLDDLYQKVYLPASVIYVQNTMLNKIGITQLIVENMEIETVRGSINIPITLTFKENIPGKSLIIA